MVEKGVCINLDEDWRITSDNNNWILEWRNGLRWQAEGKGGYFSNLGSLINYYINVDLRASNCKTLVELRDRLESVTSRVLQAVAPIDKVGLTSN